MKYSIKPFVVSTLLFAQILWISATPALAAPPHQASSDLLEPTIVESCPGFSPFDAAVVLQEAVNSDEPIGNLSFGPLDDETLSLGEEGGMQGFCGYVNATPATGEVDESQTHLLTTVDADHAVVARHLTLDFGTNTFPREWVDLYSLVAMVGAANPEYDSEAIFDALYNSAGYTPFPEALQVVAAGATSFKAEWLEVGENQPYEEILWLWQTLDDGYFSLLMARTGLEYSLVAARLGSDVNEQRVKGYSLVILDQIAAGDSTDQEATTDETADATAESEPASLDCALLSDDDAAILVGETALAYQVADETSYGCKYLPESTTDESTEDNGLPYIDGSGALMMVLSNEFALQSFGSMAQGVEAEGASEGEVEALQAAVQNGDLVAALQALAQIDLQTEMLHIAALPAVSDDALWVRFTDSGEKGAIFMRSLPDGQLLQIVVIRPDLAEAEASTVEEIEAAIGEVGVRALTDFAQALADQAEATEPLTVEEKDGLPLPSDYTSYSSEGSKFRRVVEATSPSSLPSLVEFFSTELPTGGWQSIEETTVSEEGETFTAHYEGEAGTLQLTLTVGDEETLIQIATSDSAAAEAEGILPAKGKGRIYFVNAGTQELTLTIGKETITVAPGAGAESPTDAPHLDLAPKTYQVTIRLGNGKTAGEEIVSEVTLSAGEVWVVAWEGEFEFVSQVY